MHDPPARGHELKIARSEGPFVAGEVFVVGHSFEHVGDSLLAAVRVVGEAGAGGDVEVVEHEEGAEVAEVGGSD